MRKLLLSAILLSSTAMANHRYAAIALSPTTGAFGQSVQWTLPAAQIAAVNFCGVYDCQVVVSVVNGCAAVATSPTGTYGYAHGVLAYQVAAAAVNNCQLLGGGFGCGLHASVCTH